jgi:predicted nucleic acid-binding protein
MPSDFVVDNSVVMAWCFDDEADSYTDAIQDSLTHNVAYVPSIWPLEVTNVLLVAERKKRITKAASGHFIAMLSQLPIVVDSTEQERVFHDIMSLARQYKLTSCDACYLELAIRKGLPIASLDNAILKAANDIQIQIIGTNE